ncbi:MAG TPA: GntR family transcriptional regulator, partial [Verrucomicrobiae bacterium]|nr:GntR family transcriptional regulator [Verrucomicrobiae bacterium]
MKKTTAMYIAEEITTRIAKGLLHPGEHLVETVLAEIFQTSRAPIREALLMLERDRLVQRVPHQGVVVRNFTRNEIHEIYEVVYRLEEFAMEKAVATTEHIDLAQLDEVLEEQRQAVSAGDVFAYYELNEKFHNTLFAIARNRVLRETYQSLLRSIRPFRMLSLGQGNNLEQSFLEHQNQVEALRTRDVGEGKRAIQAQETR